MTQGELFQEVIKRIKPTEAERKEARDHRNYVQRILDNRELGIIGVRSYGSYAKRTGVRPLNDIDLIVYISPEKYPRKNPDRVLHLIARNIRSSFPQNEVIPSTRSVKVKYSSGFTVDIVPAFSLDTRNLEPAEILDRQTSSWIETSPSKHIDFTNYINSIDGRYKNLIRIFKVWKEQRRRTFRSILIELLIADAILNDAVPRGWGEAIYSIFDYVKDHELLRKIYFTQYHSKPSYYPKDPVVVLDPVNPKNNVANDFTWNSKNEFMNAWSQDTKIAHKALNSKYKTDIVENWKKIFGDTIPSRY